MGLCWLMIVRKRDIRRARFRNAAEPLKLLELGTQVHSVLFLFPAPACPLHPFPCRMIFFFQMTVAKFHILQTYP